MMDVVTRDSIQTENEDEGGFQSRCPGNWCWITVSVTRHLAKSAMLASSFVPKCSVILSNSKGCDEKFTHILNLDRLQKQE